MAKCNWVISTITDGVKKPLSICKTEAEAKGYVKELKEFADVAGIGKDEMFPNHVEFKIESATIHGE